MYAMNHAAIGGSTSAPISALIATPIGVAITTSVGPWMMPTSTKCSKAEPIISAPVTATLDEALGSAFGH